MQYKICERIVRLLTVARCYTQVESFDKIFLLYLKNTGLNTSLIEMTHITETNECLNMFRTKINKKYVDGREKILPCLAHYGASVGTPSPRPTHHFTSELIHQGCRPFACCFRGTRPTAYFASLESLDRPNVAIGIAKLQPVDIFLGKVVSSAVGFQLHEERTVRSYHREPGIAAIVSISQASQPGTSYPVRPHKL